MAKSSPIDQGLAAYFKLNAANYAGLIDELLNDTERMRANIAEILDAPVPSVPDAKLIAARRAYFETAIAKGAELGGLPRRIGSFSVDELNKAARDMPDKEATGWVGISGLGEQKRQAFAEAAAKRDPALRWDKFFGPAQTEIVLPFADADLAQSFDDKIRAYIDRYNEAAAQNLATARAQDAEALRQNPAAQAKAGNTIDQRRIGLDPERRINPKTGKPFPLSLQTLNPNKAGEQWEPGPKLSKFLQDQFEWDLFDVVERMTDVKDSPLSANQDKRAGLKSIAHQRAQDTDDLFDADQLCVVISRDPQKIGEMSTGQRWRSCMSSDGCNYRYVEKDIKQGTLVAYVVHKDDLAARYPLMRQLLKPFRNKQGEIILVPAKAYGGEGNGSSRTRDALSVTLNGFVARQNEGRTGEFAMDKELYPDGQATVARLQKDWSARDIVSAAMQYRGGALPEWVTEIKGKRERVSQLKEHLTSLAGRAGHINDDVVAKHIKETENDIKKIEGQLKKLQSKVRRSFDAGNLETGLPRMFFREMKKSGIGAIPGPRQIAEAIPASETLRIEGEAFKALMAGDAGAWEVVRNKLHPERNGKIQLPLYAAAAAEPGSETEKAAIEILKKEVSFEESLTSKAYACKRILDQAPYHRALVNYAAQEMSALAETINYGNSPVMVCLRAALRHMEPDGEEARRATAALLRLAPAAEEDQRAMAIAAAVDHAPKGSVEQARAMKMALAGMGPGRTYTEHQTYEKVARYYPIDSPERIVALSRLMKIINNDSAYRSVNQYRKVAELAPPGSPVSWHANARLMKLVRSSRSGSMREIFDMRVRLAGDAAIYPEARKLFEQAGNLILDRCFFKGTEPQEDILPGLIRENERLGPLSAALELQTRRAKTYLERAVGKAPEVDRKPFTRLAGLLQIKVSRAVQAVTPRIQPPRRGPVMQRSI
jgi:hypothetical protein